MSLRIFSLSLIALLASCEKSGGHNVIAAAADADRIECAAGGEPIARDCIVERSGELLTARRSDGGFRRFVVSATGTVMPADGADVGVSTTLPDGRAEVRIDGETYRLPVK